MARASYLSVVRNAGPDNSDPIFETIEHHRRCAAIWSQVVERSDDCDAPPAVWAARDAAFDKLVRTHPTTIPDVIAFLEYFASYAGRWGGTYWPDGFDLQLARHLTASLERITSETQNIGESK